MKLVELTNRLNMLIKTLTLGRPSAALLTCAAILAFASSALGQLNSKFEIRVPKIVVRVKSAPPPKPARKAAAPGAVQTKTYGDDVFIAGFEASLENGNDALKAGNPDDAMEYFEQAALVTSDDPRPLIGMGVALWTKKKYPEAQAKFESADKRFQAIYDQVIGSGLEFSGSYGVEIVQIYGGLGYAALMAGNYDLGLKAYLNILDSKGVDGMLLSNNLGVALAGTESFRSAEGHFLSALRTDPKAQDVRFNLGMLYVITRDHEKANAVLKELTSADPYRGGVLQREIENMRPAPGPD